MKAAVHERYGSPEDVVEIRELDKPEPADDEVLVRVRASSVNIAEWYGVMGRPWIARPTTGLRGPKDIRLGVDYAGIVEAVGKDVTEFRAGDEVFGGRSGAWAEYVCVRAERAIVTKPGSVTFEQAGAVGTAAITALQGLRDKGGLVPGQKVLINGASGGVGTYAVQIAKALGAEVTAVCSAPNVEIARSLGADLVDRLPGRGRSRGAASATTSCSTSPGRDRSPSSDACSSRAQPSSWSEGRGPTDCSGRSATLSGHASGRSREVSVRRSSSRSSTRRTWRPCVTSWSPGS